MICEKCCEDLMRLHNDRWKVKNIERLYINKKRAENVKRSVSSATPIDSETSSEISVAAEVAIVSPAKNQNISVQGLKKFECLICNKKFTRRSTVKYHIAYKHEKKKRFWCDLCGKSFYEIYQIRSHITNNHTARNLKTLDESRPFKCSKCLKRSKTLGDLIRHETLTHGSQFFYIFNFTPININTCFSWSSVSLQMWKIIQNASNSTRSWSGALK